MSHSYWFADWSLPWRAMRFIKMYRRVVRGNVRRCEARNLRDVRRRKYKHYNPHLLSSLLVLPFSNSTSGSVKVAWVRNGPRCKMESTNVMGRPEKEASSGQARRESAGESPPPERARDRGRGSRPYAHHLGIVRCPQARAVHPLRGEREGERDDTPPLTASLPSKARGREE